MLEWTLLTFVWKFMVMAFKLFILHEICTCFPSIIFAPQKTLFEVFVIIGVWYSAMYLDPSNSNFLTADIVA